MLVLVSYDVSTTTKEGRSRLRKVARTCQGYGQRVQLSLFECLVDNAQWEVFKGELLEQINLAEDSLRCYFLGNRWRGKVEHFGTKGTIDLEGPLVL